MNANPSWSPATPAATKSSRRLFAMLATFFVLIALLAAGMAGAQINISTGLNTAGLAQTIGAADANWIIAAGPTAAGTTAKASNAYPGYWEITPYASTNAQWINPAGAANNLGNIPGTYTFERDINIASGTASMTYNLQIADDDSLVAFELIRPNLSIIPLTVVPTTVYHLSNLISGTITYPATGHWKLRAKVYFTDGIAGLLVSGNVQTSIDSLCDMYRDDFSDSTGWVHPMTAYTCATDYSDISISGGTFNFVNANDGHFNYMYRTGISIGNTWKANIDFTPTAFGTGNGTGSNLLALTAGIKPFAYDNTSNCFGLTTNPCSYPGIAPCGVSPQKGLSLFFSSNTPSAPTSWFYGVSLNDGSGSAPTTIATITTTNIAGTGTFYPSLEQTGTTTGKLSVFADAGRTTHIAGSPVVFAIPGGMSGLNTVQIGVQESGFAPRSLSATLDNICISSHASPAPTAVARITGAGAGLFIFPNPVSATLTINSETKLTHLQIIGITGNLIYESSEAATTYHVDMHTFAPGMYIVKAVSDSGMSTMKVYKD